MKNKTSKILVLALSAVLLIGAIFGIGAMAQGGETSVTHEAEILFNNLEYGEKLFIQYAAQVDGTAVSGTNVRMEFYKSEAGEYVNFHTQTTHSIETIKVNDVEHTVYIFNTPGIAPKEMTAVIYAQFVATVDGVEYKSDMKSFSIAEYFYKRLYKDAKTTKDQRDLYTNYLATGNSLQLVLGYNTNDKPSDYFYVNAEGASVYSATIDGTEYSFNAGIFKPDTFTLPAYENEVEAGMIFKSWNVAKAGSETEKLAAGTEVTIDNHIILTPFIDSMAIKFEDNTTGSITTSTGEGMSDYFKTEIVADPKNADNKVLHYYSSKPSVESSIKLPVETLVADGNYYELSYDFYFDGKGEFNDASGASVTSIGSSMFTQRFYRADNTELMRVNNNYTTIKSDRTSVSFASANQNGVTVTRPGPDQLSAWDYLTSTLTNGEWNNVRIEFYKQTDNTYIARYFFNNVFVAENQSWKNTGEIAYYSVVTASTGHASAYFDNISFFRAEKDYEAIEDTIEGSASGSGVYFDSETSGYRIDFTTTNSAENGINSLKDTDFGFSAPAYVSSYRTAFDDNYGLIIKDTQGLTNGTGTTHNFDSELAASNSTDTFVVEMDMAFQDMGKSGLAFMVFQGQADGKRGDIYFATTTDGKVRIGLNSTKVSGTQPILDTDKWYNIRLEFKTGGNVDIYIDNILTATYESADYDRFDATAGRLGLNLHNSAVDGAKIAVDNIYIGYIAAE